MRDISLQQTVPHVEMHEGHLSLPILSLLVLGGANCVPWPPAFTQFQPLEWNITTTVTMEHYPNYIQSFQPLEQNITTTVTMEHHPYYTQHFQLLEWNITTV